jgi:hypothetical protein
MHIERCDETEGLRGIEHRFCEDRQRTEIAISDAEVHFELVFESREEYDQFMHALDCACHVTGKASAI